MKNFKNYTKGLLSFALVFLISNSSFATATSNGGGVSNKAMFYIFLTLAIVILLGIFFLANAIKNLLGSDFFIQGNKREKGGDKSTLLTLLLLIGLPFASFSQGGAASGATDDISIDWVWAMVLVNVILVAVLFYLRGIFFSLLHSVKPKKVKIKKGKEVKGYEPSTLAKILTDVVPIEREDEIMTDHEYDGIRELDNNLPPWWLWSFYASIIFAVIYILNYHVFKTADLQIAEYEKTVEMQDKEVKEYLKSMKLNIDESSVVLLTDAKDINAGKKLYDKKCFACHGKSGEGVIGPNLTDDYWVKGGDIKDVFKVIKYGTDKGMQAWKDELNPTQMQQVASFIKSIRGTVEGGKEPQGELYQEEGSEATANTDSTVVAVEVAE